MPRIKAVVFDMDGTLVDSKDMILGAFRHVLGVLGQTYDEAVVSTYVGKRLDKTYESLAPDVEFTKILKLHRNWQANNTHLNKGFDGLEGLLRKLKKRNLKLGLFTSALKPRTNLLLDSLKIRKYFDAVVDGEDVVNTKPHPEGVKLVADKLNLPLDQIVVVGDAEHDILSGKNAGALTIGITHGFGTKKSLKESGADYIVGNFDELSKKLIEVTS